MRSFEGGYRDEHRARRTYAAKQPNRVLTGGRGKTPGFQQFEPLRGPSRIMLAALTLAGSGLWVMALVVLTITAGVASAISLALLIAGVVFALALLTLLVGWQRKARRQR